MLKQGTLTFVITMISIYILAGFVAIKIPIYTDVRSLLHATERLLKGGNYATDFFETSPPMILYLYIPSVIFSKLLSIQLILTLQIFIFLLASFSLFLCYTFINKIFYSQDTELAHLFVITLAIIFLLLPLNELGQREHLLIILMMPYLFLTICRLEHMSINIYHAALIGFLAALGFAIKPYFVATFLAIEFYYMLHRRHILAWVKIETIIIISVLLVYLMLIFILHQDYIFIVVPYAIKYYYKGVSESWKNLIYYPLVVFSLIPISLYLIHYKNNRYKILSNLLLVTLISLFLFSYLLQRTSFYYHVLPMLSIAILMLVLLFGQIIKQSHTNKITYFLISLLGLFVFSYLCLYHETNCGWAMIILNPVPFFCYFAILFSILLYFNQVYKNIYKIIILSLFINSIAIYFSYITAHTNLSLHQFSLTVLILILLFGIVVPTNHKNKIHSIFMAFLAALFFALPYYFLTNTYTTDLIRYKASEEIMNFMQTHAKHQPVYFLASSIFYIIPSIDYANAIPATRFITFWMIGGLIKEEQQTIDSKQQHKILKDKNFLIEMIAEDLEKNKPHLIFVDTNTYKYTLGYIHFEYVDDFMQNQRFRKAWQAYQYLTTLEQHLFLQPSYKFAIYQRID